ncbi:MAG: tandem-95 repeat protein [Planctomycetota bacterium]
MSSRPVEIQGGTLSGFGIITGDVVSGGTTAPGTIVGDANSIQIQGDYTLAPSVSAGGPYDVDEGGLVQLEATIGDTSGVLEIEIEGPTSFDQLIIQDRISLGSTLNVTFLGGFAPAVGETFTIIENSGSNGIGGAFAGLPENGVFTVDSTKFQISYSGGTGNDVVLTVVDPATPNQGGETLSFEWDLDGDNSFGETGSAAEQGDETGRIVLYSAEEIAGPAENSIGVRVTYGTTQSDISTTTVNVSDVAAVELPDLTFDVSGITFSPPNPIPGETVSVTASIKNQGLLEATDVSVSFRDFGTLLDSGSIASLAPGETQDVTVSTVFPEAGFRFISVEIDPSDSIEELFEENNETSQLLSVGTPDPASAQMVVASDEVSAACGVSVVSITGNATYNFESSSGTETFPVQGGRVSVTIIDPSTSNIVGVFTGGVTGPNGSYRQVIVTPAGEGTFALRVQVTDETSIGEFETTLDVLSDESCQPEEPDPTPAILLRVADNTVSETAGAEATLATVTRRNFTDTSEDLTVSLSSNDASEATVPTQVVIPANETSVSFFVSAIDDEVVDGSQRVTLSAEAAGLIGRTSLLVADDEAPPPPPPTGTFDISVIADDIFFSDENPGFNETINILASINYTGSEPVSNVPVTFNDIYPIDGVLSTVPIGSTVVSFPDAGASGPVIVGIPWTNRAEGVHVIQAVTEPDFQQSSTANDQATRSIVVGSDGSETVTVSYQDPPVLLVDLDGNGLVTPGDTLRYAIDFENTGSTDLTDVQLFDDFDDNALGLPFNISDGGTATSEAISWNVGSVLAGVTGSVTYDVTINAVADFPSGTNLISNSVFLTSNETVPVGDDVQLGVVLERTAPTTTATLTPAANAAGWNNSDVELVLNAVDNQGGSGVSLIVYSVDGADPIAQAGDTVTLPFTEEGVFAVAFNAVDTALNVEGSQTIEIRVDKTNPIAGADAITVDQGATSNALNDGANSVLGNDSDAPLNQLVVQLESGPSFAANFALNADGTFTYSHDDSDNFADSFSYRVFDQAGNSSVAVVQITVIETPNTPPVAVSNSVVGVEDTDVTIALGGTDADGDSITASIQQLPTDGRIFQTADGITRGDEIVTVGTVLTDVERRLIFTPDADANGSPYSNFSFIVDDGEDVSDAATVSIEILSVDDANDDAVFSDEDTVLNGDVSSNDTYSGDVLYSLNSDATNGTVIVNADGTFSYSPAGDFNGIDSFQYLATDTNGDGEIQSVVVTVKAVEDASDDVFTTEEDTALSGDVSVNDTFAGLVDYELVSATTNGTVAFLADGTFTYTPDDNFNGSDAFTYEAKDINGDIETQSVVITVVPVNDDPVIALTGSAGNELDSADQLVSWQVSDVDGNLDTVELVVAQNGIVLPALSGNVAADGEVDFNSQGIGSFRIEVIAIDSNGAVVSVVQLVEVMDDDVDSPIVEIAGSNGTELEIDTNEYSWTVEDASGLSAFSVTVTRDNGDGPVAIFSTTDIADSTGSFNFDDYGVGIYEVLVVATDADGDWAGDAASSNAGRTSVVGELYISTTTRAKLEVEDGQWVSLHRADVTSTSDGDVLFDHSQLSHPWFSWWTPNLNAFHMLADGSMVLSTDGRGSIGGQDFRDGGLVRFFGDEWLARNADNPGDLHQTARMISTEQQLFGNRSLLTGVDAISIAPDGNLVISLDRNRSLADGQSYHRGDLIKVTLRQDGTLASSELYFSHEVLDATGWRLFGRFFDQGVNVDGAHVMEDGRIVLSVSSTATAGDTEDHFRDGDVFVYDPETDLAELLFDEDSFRRNEEVDAVFIGLGNGELSLIDEQS